MKFFLTLFLFLGSSAISQASIFSSCPDRTYAVFPILGAVSGGTATSCGDADVTATTAFAATPGKGTVPTSFLSTYLGVNLSVLLNGSDYTAREGSAVRFASFSVSPGSTLSFNWEGVFEEGGTGSLFYILNGSLFTLSQIVPTNEGLPGVTTSGSVTTSLLTGSNTLGFGAITLQSNQVASLLADPRINVSDLVVTSTSTAVPEPATFGLMGVALAGLALFGRRRKS